MTSEPLGSMLLVTGVYLAMFALGELLRWRRFGAEATRKFAHVAAGAIALALPLLFDSPWPVFALAAPFVMFLAGTLIVGWLRSVHGISRRSAGALLYPIAIAATFAIASDSYVSYAIAVLALALADPAAGIVGGRWGRHPYSTWSQLKTWEGSLAALAVTSALATIVLALDGAPLAEATITGIFTGLVVSLVEGALPWGLDNLGIPLAALAALSSTGSAVASGVTVALATALVAVALVAPRSRFLAVREPAGVTAGTSDEG